MLVGSAVRVAMFSLQMKLVLASRKKARGKAHRIGTATWLTENKSFQTLKKQRIKRKKKKQNKILNK